MIVKNAEVFGLEQSIRGAKFPKCVDVDILTGDLTEGIEMLAKAPTGSGHDQWLTGVIVQFDLTFSIKAWVELERYHFCDFVSSQSTMHRITRFDIERQCNEYVDKEVLHAVKKIIAQYNAGQNGENYLRVLYNIPTGFRLTARMTTNYRQLKTIYHQRKDHRLPEWREFCQWIETLPEAHLITGGAQHDI